RFVATRAKHAAMVCGANEQAANQAEQQDAVKNSHQTNIDAHVAVKYVAEFMGNNALQFIAAEQMNTTAGDTNHCVLRILPSCKSVDGFIFENINRRYRRARSDCHFLNDIEDFSFIRVL